MNGESSFQFFLGTHKPHWLGFANVPLFVSRRTLDTYKNLPVATAPWSLDSGGFSELSLYGAWSISTKQYIRTVRRYEREIGMLEWAAPMDWMCEPFILAKTGGTIRQHQARTVRSFLELADAGLPVIPVLQGFELDDYIRCWERYERAGIHLRSETCVGLGSICRRQSTDEIATLVERLSEDGLKLHGFGVKTIGLTRFASKLKSADSMAWSFDARHGPRLAGCTGHQHCQNCIKYALLWRERLLAKLGR